MKERKIRETRRNSLEILEGKIEKAKERVVKTKAAYDDAMMELTDLMDKRDAMRQEAIVKLLMNSNRTYEEIEAFLKSSPSDPSDQS